MIKHYITTCLFKKDCDEDYAEGNLGVAIKNFKAALSKISDEYRIKFQTTSQKNGEL